MSWLGGSLSTFTDQISNLTKDILTETTEEVSDPETEVKQLQTRIKELEQLVASQKSEHGRLKVLIRDAEEKAESSDLQINSMSREFRILTQEKQDEINELKHKHHELVEYHAKSAAAVTSHGQPSSVLSSLPTGQLDSGVGSSDYASEDLDFGDSISMQHEINRLSRDNQCLHSECAHWKKLASEMVSSESHEDPSEKRKTEATEYEAIIQKLYRDVQDVREQQQHELAALQDVHTDKVANLKRVYERQIADLETTSHSDADAHNSRSEEDAAEVRERIHTLEETVSTLQSERGSLVNGITQLRMTLSGSEIADITDTQLDSSDDMLLSIQMAVKELMRLRSEISQAESLDLLSDLHALRHNLNTDTLARKDKLLYEKQELVDKLIEARKQQTGLKSLILSNTDTNNAASDEISNMIEAIGNEEHQRLTREIVRSLEHENLVLQQRRLELEEQVSLLQTSINTLTLEQQEKESSHELDSHNVHSSSTDDFEATRADVSAKRSELQQMSSLNESLETSIQDLSHDKQTLERKISELHSDKVDLEQSMEELDDQHEEAMRQVICIRDSLMRGMETLRKENTAKDEQIHTLTSKIQSYEEKIGAMSPTSSSVDVLVNQQTVDSLQKQLTTKDAEIQRLLLKLNRQIYEQGDSSVSPPSSSVDVLITEQNFESFRKDLSMKDEMIEKLHEYEKSDDVGSAHLSLVDSEVHDSPSSRVMTSNALVSHSQEYDQKQWAQLNNMLEQLTDENTALKSELKLAEASADGEGIDYFIQENSALKAEMEKLKTTTEPLTDENRLLHENVAEIASNSDHLKDTIETLREKLNRNAIVLNELHMDKKELIAIVKEKEQHIEEMKLKMNDLSMERSQQQQHLVPESHVQSTLGTASNVNTAAECTNHDGEIQDLKQRLGTMQTDLDEALADKEKSGLLVKSLQAEIDHHKQYQHEVVEEKRSFEIKLKEVSEEFHAFQTNIDAHHRTELAEAFKQTEVFKVENSKLKQDLHEERESSQGLSNHVTRLQTENATVQKQVSDLDQCCNDSVTCIESLKVQNEQLQCQSGEKDKEIHEHLKKLEALIQENDSVKSDFGRLKSEKVQLENELADVRQKLFDMSGQYYELQASKEEIETKLNEKVQQQAGQNSSLEVNDSNMGVEPSSLEKGHEHLLMNIHEKDVCILELEQRLKTAEQEKNETEEIIQSTLEKQEQLTNCIAENESEILLLKQNNLLTIDENEKNGLEIVRLSTSIKHLEEKEDLYVKIKNENNHLMNEITSLKNTELRLVHDDEMSGSSKPLDVITELESELSLANDKIHLLEQENKAVQTTVLQHEKGICELNQKHLAQNKSLHESQNRLSSQENLIAVLQQDALLKDNELQVLKTKVTKAKSLIENENLQLLENEEMVMPPLLSSNLLALEYPERESEAAPENHASSSPIPPAMVTSLSDETIPTDDGLADEIDKLQKITAEKDSVISELQTNNSVLLKMLEAKSLTAHGDKSLVEVHRLETEVRGLKLEREQMLVVMTEKSRECSSLKSEVHRLMTVISAEKSALQKLQQDNHQLTHQKIATTDDMQRDALQNLSRLIRDKDLEIEALSQKNCTLLQVLNDTNMVSPQGRRQHSSGGAAGGGEGEGESGGDNSQLTNLLQDKDNLTRQLVMLQSEREQMMAFLNQKHQESISYHNEIQRLTQVLQAESVKHERVQENYNTLIPQYEDSKQSLVAIQNELIAYKQKCANLELKYGELSAQTSNKKTDSVASEQYNAKFEEAKRLFDQVTHLQKNMREKEQHIHSINVNLSELDHLLRVKESEKNSLKKQAENLMFRLETLEHEVVDLKKDLEFSESQKYEQARENMTLQETRDEQTLSAQDKDLEINTLKGKVSALADMVQNNGEKGEIDTLLKESESIKHQAKIFQQESDQLRLTMRHQQMEIKDLTAQVTRHKEKDEKLNKEVGRLRTHLIQIEEGYTQEALAAEEREKELRTRLSSAEQRLLSSSAVAETVNLQTSQHLDTLQQQLSVIASQRDQAYAHVSSLQDQVRQYAASLANLQMVLDQFQQEKEVMVAADTERYQIENNQLRQELHLVQLDLRETQTKLCKATDGLEAAARLSNQLDKKETEIHTLRQSVNLHENALVSAEEHIRQLNVGSEGKIDKTLIKNLVMGYFTTPSKERHDVLRAIGGLLQFSNDDFTKVFKEQQSGWLPGFLRFSAASPKNQAPVTPVRRAMQQMATATTSSPLDNSFSELFVKFLEKESSPPPPHARLPTEQMVTETQQRHREKDIVQRLLDQEHIQHPHHHHSVQQARDTSPQKSALPHLEPTGTSDRSVSPSAAGFNPFTAARHAVLPMQPGGRESPHQSHPLMATSVMSPTISLFSPLSTVDSGQSSMITQSSSTILQDVLANR